MTTSTSEPAARTVYRRDEVPEHLRTMTQLKADRLKPAEGQEPVAFVRVYRRGHGWGEFPLYDPAQAAAMRPLSAKQQQAMEARRTCPECGTLRRYVVHGICQECVEKKRQESLDRHRRTCVWCKRVSLAQHPRSKSLWGRRGECVPCWLRRVIRLQFEAEQRAVWRRTCPGRDCAVVTATDEEIAAVKAAGGYWERRWCPPCKARDDEERAERDRQAREAEQRAVEDRRRQVAELSAWARDALADPQVVILDTETTGLDDEARIVEIAVTTAGGEVLLDTLLDPGECIPADASAIHGITDATVAGAPSFADILVRLTAVLDGRRCLIYNRSYDVGQLHHELTRHYQAAGHERPDRSASAWLEGMTFEDAMIPYSDWYGDWSEYWGNYAWQPLSGGHRALGDCCAVADRLRDMAVDQTTAEKKTV